MVKCLVTLKKWLEVQKSGKKKFGPKSWPKHYTFFGPKCWIKNYLEA